MSAADAGPNPLPPLATRQEAHRIVTAFSLIMAILVGIALWMGPVVSYHCEAGELGVTCAQTQWYGGVIRGDTDLVERIRSARSEQKTVRASVVSRAPRTAAESCAGRRDRTRIDPTRDTLILLDDTGQILREFGMNAVVGSSAADIAWQINSLAGHRRSDPFTRWMAPFWPWLTASSLLLFCAVCIPLTYQRVVGASFEPKKIVRVAQVTGGLLLAVWIVLFLGEAPGFVASWFGLSGG